MELTSTLTVVEVIAVETVSPVNTHQTNHRQIDTDTNTSLTYIFEDGVAIYTGANVEDVTAKVQAEIAKMK